jgi:alcohol dehydrogenase class IV
MVIGTFSFNTASSIVFGAGSAARLGEIAAERLGRRVLLVTDRGLVAAGLVAPAVASLEQAGCTVAVYDKVIADPPESVVLEAVGSGNKLAADAVIGLGGGSSLDVAKLVALLLKSGERLVDIYGVGQVRGKRLPLLLSPTTAGTGSEVTPISIVTTGAHEKKGVVSPVLLPDIALLDPELTYGLPAPVTAATGVDAMVHAIESFTSTSANRNPISAALATEVLRLLAANIAAAVHRGDHEARGRMLLGSMLAGQRPSRTRRSRPCMPWPIRSAAITAYRTDSRMRWFCLPCSNSISQRPRAPMPNSRRTLFRISLRNRRPAARRRSSEDSRHSRPNSACRRVCAMSGFPPARCRCSRARR